MTIMTCEQVADGEFSDRMATVEFDVAADAHIVVDCEVCRSCTTRACVSACPANFFAPTADGGILFNYEDCFECGTCYLLCNNEGAISWNYPKAATASSSVGPDAHRRLHEVGSSANGGRSELRHRRDRPPHVRPLPGRCAALEVAFLLAEHDVDSVTVVCAGPEEAEAMLRDALAWAPTGRTLRCRCGRVGWVAEALGVVCAGADLVLCGDYSADRDRARSRPSSPPTSMPHRRSASSG